jgi:hypothetical protein
MERFKLPDNVAKATIDYMRRTFAEDESFAVALSCSFMLESLAFGYLYPRLSAEIRSQICPPLDIDDGKFHVWCDTLADLVRDSQRGSGDIEGVDP